MKRCVVLLLLSLIAHAAGHLYGLAMVRNGPSEVALTKVSDSGNATIVGPPLMVTDAMGDLTAVDVKSRVLYYLGDTVQGATLVGVSLDDGREQCRGLVPIHEIGYVGIGQSLDWDENDQSLVVTGLWSNTTTHVVLRNKGCIGGRLSANDIIGSFGDGNYLPMNHASALDSAGQRLFLSVALNKTVSGIGIVDLKKLSMKVIPEDSSQHIMAGMQWDPVGKRLLGIAPTLSNTPNLFVRTLELTAEGAPVWKDVVVPHQPYQWLYGNSGTVSAFDPQNGFLYILAAKVPSMKPGKAPSMPPMHLIKIDVHSGRVVASPPTSGLPMGVNTLDELNFVAGA